MRPLKQLGHNPVTPVIGAALAAVGAAALIGFALLAQVTAPDLSTAPHRTAIGSSTGTSPNAIVLPSPSANGSSGGTTEAPQPPGTTATIPTGTVAFVPGSGPVTVTPPAADPQLGTDPRTARGLDGPGFAPGPRGTASEDGWDGRRTFSAKDDKGEDHKGKDARGHGAAKGHRRAASDRDDRVHGSSLGDEPGSSKHGASKAHGNSNGHSGSKGHDAGPSKGKDSKGNKDKSHGHRGKGRGKH